MSNASKPFNSTLFAAGLLGLSGVGLGALGAHGLKAMLLERGMAQAWETAARYHIIHAVALLGLAGWARGAGHPRLSRWIGGAWMAGVVLFSGSLYGLALGGPRWLGPVTPLGGVVLILGWLLVVMAAWSKEE